MAVKTRAVGAAALMAALSVVAGGPALGASDQAHVSPTLRTESPQPHAQWRARAPMPQARAEVGVAALGGRVYVVGGTVLREGGAPIFASRLVTRYNPRTDRWSRRAPLPRGLTHVGVAALRGRLYAVGGFTDIVHLHPQPVAYVYAPYRNTWRRLPDMPRRLGSVSVAAVDGRLHVLGGRASRTVVPIPGTDPPIFQGYGTVRTHLVYHPVQRTWSRAAPLPVTPRDHAGVAVLGHRIHVFGGRVADVEDNLSRHDVYDTRTRSWSRAAPLPTPRSAGAAVVVNGRIIYAGGECKSDPAVDPTGTYDDVTAYDPHVDRWVQLPPLPQARHAFGAARVGGHAYFVGGALTCGGGASTDTLELSAS